MGDFFNIYVMIKKFESYTNDKLNELVEDILMMNDIDCEYDIETDEDDGVTHIYIWPKFVAYDKARDHSKGGDTEIEIFFNKLFNKNKYEQVFLSEMVSLLRRLKISGYNIIEVGYDTSKKFGIEIKNNN
jgi:hypothetical protein